MSSKTMGGDCPHCSALLADTDLNMYFSSVRTWHEAVRNGTLVLVGGNSPIDGYVSRVTRETQYIYEHVFKCECSKYLYSGVCIRSSEPVLAFVDSLNAEFRDYLLREYIS